MSEEILDPIEEQYNAIKAAKIKTEKKSVIYDKKNYLDTKLGNNEKEKKIVIRILPLLPDSQIIYEEVHSHYVKKANKSFVCPKNTKNTPEGTNKDCPFCDARSEAFAAQKEAKAKGNDILAEKYKEIAFANNSSKGFVARVIERSDEDFGPKFWKFSEVALDNIMDVKKNFKDEGINIFNKLEGHDLIVTIKKDDKGKSKISNISAAIKSTPISKDEKQIDAWISDSKKWTDVFVIKPFEYLEIVQIGGEPWFDKPTNKWIDKKELDKKEEEAVESEEDDDEVGEAS